MDVYSIPLPQDSKKDIQRVDQVGDIKEELFKLQEKYGKYSIPILKDVERLLSIYEGNSNNVQSKKDDCNIEKENVIKSQYIIRRFLKKKRFIVSATKFLQTPLAAELNKRNEIWKDILISERIYFQKLVLLYEIYFMPLKMKNMGSMAQDQRILNEKQIYKIFQNIEDIKNIAKTMWKKLEETCKKWPDSSPRIGGIFMSLISEIRTNYLVYIKGVSKSLKDLIKIKKSVPQFGEFIDKCEINNSSAPLYSLLMLPLERLEKYGQSLKELYILTPPDHIDYTELAKAHKEISSLNSDLSQHKIEAEKLEKVARVNFNVKGQTPNLMQTKGNNRTLIREGPISILSERKIKSGYLYLFSDVIVICELNEKYESKTFDSLISLSGAEIKDIQSQNEIFTFSLTKENRRVVLSTFTQAEKESWIKDISQLITKKKL